MTYKEWLETEAGIAHKAKISDLMTQRWQDEEYRASQVDLSSKAMTRRWSKMTPEEIKAFKEARQGKNHSRHAPFKMVIEHLDGSTEEFVFDGDHPFKEAIAEIGFGNHLTAMKKGYVHTICQNGHRKGYKIGTKVSIEMLTE